LRGIEGGQCAAETADIDTVLEQDNGWVNGLHELASFTNASNLEKSLTRSAG
jgi:hypothetical protein